MLGKLGWAVVAAGAAAGGALAQDGATVRIMVEGVRSDAGSVMAALCGAGPSPYCTDHSTLSPAAPDGTELTFEGVPPGRYVLSLFHDENGDFQPQIPPEGYAFGNDAAFPPSFETASIAVDGETSVSVTMVYIGAAQVGMAPTGSTGAPTPDGVTKTDVREGGLYGEFYRPDTEEPVPALILLGGSEGGIDTISAMAPAFAEHGYGVLALAYWGEVGLPQTLEEIPLEYFDAAAAWLQARPDVRADAIGALGWSRGSEAALLLASRNPAIRAVAGIAPSGVVWQGLDFVDPMNMGPAWTADGEPLAFVAPDAAAYVPGAAMRPMFDNALAKGVPPEAEIPVERIGGPVLLVSGGDDAMWPSATFAERIVARLEAAEFPHTVENLVYPDAGHAVFMGAPDGMMARGMSVPSSIFGGEPGADRAAWADNWPRTLAFFDAALKETGR